MNQSIEDYTKSYIILLILVLIIVYVMRYLGHLFENKLVKEDGEKDPSLIILAPGTIIHELSHAIIAFVFMYKINKISLFNPMKDGTLGYVDAKPDTNANIFKYFYQKIGNPIISFAPLFGISFILILIYRIFFPSEYNDINFQFLHTYQNASFTITQDIIIVLTIMMNGFLSLGGFIKGIIFLILLAVFSSGMVLSKADIQTSKYGMITFIVFTFAFGIFLNSFLPELSNLIIMYINIFISFSIVLIFFQLITLLIMYKIIK